MASTLLAFHPSTCDGLHPNSDGRSTLLAPTSIAPPKRLCSSAWSHPQHRQIVDVTATAASSAAAEVSAEAASVETPKHLLGCYPIDPLSISEIDMTDTWLILLEKEPLHWLQGQRQGCSGTSQAGCSAAFGATVERPEQVEPVHRLNGAVEDWRCSFCMTYKSTTHKSIGP